MSAFGPTKSAGRRSRAARLGLATGLAALALPLVSATAAHAADNDQHTNAPAISRVGWAGDRDDDTHTFGHRLSTRAVTTRPAAFSAAPAATTTTTTTGTTAATTTGATVTAASLSLSTVTGSGDVAPLAGIRITEPYGVRGPWAADHHTGVDLAASVGTQVRAVGTGTVVRSGWDGAYGNDVLVHMTDGDYTLYAHLSQTSVAAGQQVTAGEQVGRSGATGHVTGPHLHFEVRTTPNYGSDINPLAYLRSHGVAI